MSKIYGTIGFVFLTKGNKKIIVLADQHNTLPECDNKINIGMWFKKKFNTSKILLEEVPREDNKLIELWQESPHTQELKNLYLDNSTIISGMDVRPFMIPFSWEVLEDINLSDKNYNITIIEYLKEIDNFFTLQNKYLIDNLSNYNYDILKNNLLGKHFLIIKRRYNDFLKDLSSKKLLNEKIRFLYNNYNTKLLSLNNLLDDIMEWYICGQIHLYSDKPIIIHAGLAHTTKIIKFLESHYEYDIKYQEGLNDLEYAFNRNRVGCINLPNEIDVQFGGKNKL